MPITLAYIGIARAEAKIAIIRPFFDWQRNASFTHAFLNELEIPRHLRPLRCVIQRWQCDAIWVARFGEQATGKCQIAPPFWRHEHGVRSSKVAVITNPPPARTAVNNAHQSFAVNRG